MEDIERPEWEAGPGAFHRYAAEQKEESSRAASRFYEEIHQALADAGLKYYYYQSYGGPEYELFDDYQNGKISQIDLAEKLKKNLFEIALGAWGI